MFSTACLPCESTKHPVLTIMSVWKVISSEWAGCQREGEKKTDEHPENFNRFFQLHQAVVCYSISPVSVLSIFVHLHRRDGSDLPPCYLSPAAVYKTSFLINSVFSVCNCHLPVMKINAACLIWSGDQYSSDTCMYRLQATVKCNIHFPIARTQCKGLTVTQNVCWNFCISTNEGPS